MKFGFQITFPVKNGKNIGVISKKETNETKETTTIENKETLETQNTPSPEQEETIKNLKNEILKLKTMSENDKNAQILQKNEEIENLKKEYENFKIESEKIFTEKLSKKIKIEIEKANELKILEIQKDKKSLEQELSDRYDHFEELNLHITNLLKEKKGLKKELGFANGRIAELENEFKVLKEKEKVKEES